MEFAVHFRIGDYANEPQLGILPDSYYEVALSALGQNVEHLLLFSDTPSLATERAKFLTKANLTTCPGSFSAPETLVVMRSCKNFVIANSSMSWWGAFLGHADSQLGQVVCPDPWFFDLKTESALTPQTWTKVTSWTS
jgi:hypothetical protein